MHCSSLIFGSITYGSLDHGSDNSWPPLIFSWVLEIVFTRYVAMLDRTSNKNPAEIAVKNGLEQTSINPSSFPRFELFGLGIFLNLIIENDKRLVQFIYSFDLNFA